MKQVCHRDLKLENTLLDGSPAPRLKICDFGYSKVLLSSLYYFLGQLCVSNILLKRKKQIIEYWNKTGPSLYLIQLVWDWGFVVVVVYMQLNFNLSSLLLYSYVLHVLFAVILTVVVCSPQCCIHNQSRLLVHLHILLQKCYWRKNMTGRYIFFHFILTLSRWFLVLWLGQVVWLMDEVLLSSSSWQKFFPLLIFFFLEVWI